MAFDRLLHLPMDLQVRRTQQRIVAAVQRGGVMVECRQRTRYRAQCQRLPRQQAVVGRDALRRIGTEHRRAHLIGPVAERADDAEVVEEDGVAAHGSCTPPATDSIVSS